MRIIKQEQQEITVTTDILCNKCGKSCKGNIGNFNGLIETVIAGAYDSTHLDDLTRYAFSMCEKCLSELFLEFKIPVEMLVIPTM